MQLKDKDLVNFSNRGYANELDLLEPNVKTYSFDFHPN